MDSRKCCVEKNEALKRYETMLDEALGRNDRQARTLIIDKERKQLQRGQSAAVSRAMLRRLQSKNDPSR